MALMFAVLFGTAMFAVTGAFITRKFFGYKVLEKNNDVAGFIYGVLGVMYSVFLAFVIIDEWEIRRDAESNIQQEVNSLASVYRGLNLLENPQVTRIQSTIEEYFRVVANNEWPLMAEGKASVAAERQSIDIIQSIYHIEPRSRFEELWLVRIISDLDAFESARLSRIMSAKYTLNVFFWAVLVSGAILTIGFAWLFGTPNFLAQSIMMAFLGAVMAMLICIALSLDHPFKGIIPLDYDEFLNQSELIKGDG